MNILIAKDLRKELGKMYEITDSHIKQIEKAFPGAKVEALKPDDPGFYDSLSSAEYLISPHFNSNFENANNLKLVHITSAGVDKIPQNLIDQRVMITNSSGVHPVPITEHVFAYLLMFSRQIHKTHKNQILGKGWAREFDKLNIFELAGKTICIVGLGRIGRRIAKLAKAFDMKVIGVVRSPDRKEEFVDKLVGEDRLADVVHLSDAVVNCLPHTEKTFQIFDKQIFNKMKSDAYFVNIGRGQTVNEVDLRAALKSKKIAGAGLDVFEIEPLPSESPLWKMENVIITPHYAGWTPNYMDRVIDIFCDNLKAYLKNKHLPNLVDLSRGY
jgi:D-2-hydroxyacid dehydrogenase (NADP+)